MYIMFTSERDDIPVPLYSCEIRLTEAVDSGKMKVYALSCATLRCMARVCWAV